MRSLLGVIATVALAIGASLLFQSLFGHLWTGEASILVGVGAGFVLGRFVFRPWARRNV